MPPIGFRKSEVKNLNRVHLNGLRAVEALGRLGSLTRAAEELGVTPGAVSQQLARTQAQLGRPLFERTARGLVPTLQGAQILARLSTAFGALDAALGDAFRLDGTVLTVSVAPVFAAKWLVPRLHRFAARHPGTAVRLDASAELKSPDARDIDLCIRVGGGHWTGVAKELLLSQKLFPVCAPSLAARLRTPADILDLPIIEDMNSNLSWDLWLRPHGLDAGRLRIAHGFTDASLALDAAAAGLGVLLAWQTLAHDALRSGALAAPLPHAVDSGFGYWLISSAKRRDTPAMASFRRWLREELADMTAGPG